MTTGGGVAILIAFLAGIVSFASPCVLPLVPAYVGYMVGTDVEGVAARRRAALYQSLAFVVGFSIVFITLWASIGLVGYVLRDYVGLLRQVGGAILIFMGLNVAGVIDVAAFYREVHIPVGAMGGASMGFGQAAPAGPSYRRSALLGIVFAAGWTPCIGPILGGIIGLAAVSASVAEGTLLLIAYAAGLAIPFVLVAIGATAISHRLGWLREHQRVVSAVTGAMLVAVGFLMITNTFARLSGLFAPLGS
jgi:cytochrome c-type biogenesis protein